MPKNENIVLHVRTVHTNLANERLQSWFRYICVH